jgi:hypothetical protein
MHLVDQIGGEVPHHGRIRKARSEAKTIDGKRRKRMSWGGSNGSIVDGIYESVSIARRHTCGVQLQQMQHHHQGAASICSTQLYVMQANQSVSLACFASLSCYLISKEIYIFTLITYNLSMTRGFSLATTSHHLHESRLQRPVNSNNPASTDLN